MVNYNIQRDVIISDLIGQKMLFQEDNLMAFEILRSLTKYT